MRFKLGTTLAALAVVSLCVSGPMVAPEPVAAAQGPSINIGTLEGDVRAVQDASREITAMDNSISRAATTTKKKALADTQIRQVAAAGREWTLCLSQSQSAIEYLHEAKKNSGWASASKRTRDFVKCLARVEAVYVARLEAYLEAERRARGRF